MSQTKHTKYYDSISQGYGGLYKEEQLKKIRIIKSFIINNIINIDNKNNKNKINDNKVNNKKNKNINDYKILDVGCGPGFSEIISKDIIGIDPSFELLKKASIKRVNGVAESLPFKDNLFDVIISVTAIHNFNNIEKAVKEMKRVVKGKNNNIIITILKKSPKFNNIKNILNKNFRIKNIIEEEKDVIFLCEGKV